MQVITSGGEVIGKRESLHTATNINWCSSYEEKRKEALQSICNRTIRAEVVAHSVEHFPSRAQIGHSGADLGGGSMRIRSSWSASAAW